ncbi:MAG: cell envelope integrity protein CreD [Alphaproteobacteria bacterium CG_4_10_14_0_2_um_filter_63_37]|nr:MAG: hypothetical protein AUJ55_08285 [Proteobacteria bacterium CG1_02_64_396]PJA23586.1 MAG: cell envelope integrity protein CreD [Alphaproteobacteria bacterium CG_4_10_14_0_2_um_filter_63_37]
MEVVLWLLLYLLMFALVLYGLAKGVTLAIQGIREGRMNRVFSGKEGSSLNVRVLVIAGLALAMLIPLGMVQGVTSERNGLYDGVIRDIAATWGGQQVVQGPALAIPFTVRWTTEESTVGEDGKVRKLVQKHEEVRHRLVLPETVDMNIAMDDEFRTRGIYRSLVYTADIRISGRFLLPRADSFPDKTAEIHWGDTFLAMGLSDTRAINRVSSLAWGDKSYPFAPGTKITQTIPHGFHALLEGMNPDRPQIDFQFLLNTNGSSGLRFTAFGEQTKVVMHSSWPHPSFQGDVLPSSHEIEGDGFDAVWEIPNLARNFPQSWVLETERFEADEFMAGVDLFESVFLYSTVTRAVKYGLLFIVLTFLTFLIFELTVGAPLHYVQYALIGGAISLFYLLLLSLAEHIDFLSAYLVAATTTIVMISGYAASALGSIKKGGIVLVLLAGLYLFLYSLLQMEDYALLMGTLLLTSVLAVLMFLTRKLRPNGDRPEMVEAQAP